MLVLRKPITAAFLICLLFVGAGGCAGLLPSSAPSASRPHLSEEGNSKYYYYTVSLLEKKTGNAEKAREYLERAARLDADSLFLKKEIALMFLQQGDGQAALPIVEEILQKDPKHVDALIMYGSILQHDKKYAEAEALFEEVISIAPDRRAIFMNLGAMYVEDEKYDKALAVYKKLVAKHPDAYFGYFSIGKVYEKINDIENAEKYYLETIAVEPDLLEPRFELLKFYKKDVFAVLGPDSFDTVTVSKKTALTKFILETYGKSGHPVRATLISMNPDLADVTDLPAGTTLSVPKKSTVKQHPDALDRMRQSLDVYRKILELNPENDRAAIEISLFYAKLGLLTEADAHFEQIARKSETDRSIIDTIYFLFFEQEQYEDAAAVLLGLLQFVPNNSDMNHLVGAAFDKLGKKDLAIEHFLKVEQDSRFYENAVVHAAYLYQSTEQPDKALALVERALQEFPENTEFYLYLGAFYEEMEDYEKAASILRNGLVIDDKHAALLFRLGVVYDKWGKKDESIAQMKRVIELNPKDAHALNYLGYTYLDLDRNLDQAEELIRKANQLAPEDGYITDSLGWVYYKNGKYEKAVELLEKAASLVPNDPIILEHLGDAYLKTDSPEKAIEYYRRALMQKKKDTSELEQKIQDLSN